MLCKGFPAEFRSYFEHVSLRFDDRPDYDYMKRLFRELFFRKGYSYDNIYDWDVPVEAAPRPGLTEPLRSRPTAEEEDNGADGGGEDVEEEEEPPARKMRAGEDRKHGYSTRNKSANRH